jgi:hypothetical protein
MEQSIINYDYNTLLYFPLFYVLLKIQYEIIYTYLYLTYYNIIYKLPYHKRLYIIKNFSKSINLGLFSLFSIPYILYPIILNHPCNNHLYHICGAFYSSNDLFALINVPKISKTTRNHHIITISLSIISFSVDFNKSELGKMLFIYTLFSTYAFIVNYYLGSRFFHNYEKNNKIRVLSRNIYTCSLFLNWTWHIFHFIQNYHILSYQHFIYYFMLYWIIKDDIILLNWLNKKSILIKS